MSFGTPGFLLLLPLAALPWLRPQATSRRYSWLQLLPKDPASQALDHALRALTSLAIVCVSFGSSAPTLSERPIEQVGRGAQIAVLLDRSVSMDQSFAGRVTASAAAGEGSAHDESKGAAARRLLEDFVRHREHDLIGMLVFSTVPLRVIDFTDKPAVVRAAIEAGDIGHGLGETDIGGGLDAALSLFENQPYNGSRVILLVSDGGARLDIDTQLRIAELMKRDRIALYWLYLRTAHGPRILDAQPAQNAAEEAPERLLHEYFRRMGSPYHAYEAEDPQALALAMADIDRLQSLPIRYRHPAARRDLSKAAYAVALGCTLVLTLASWSQARPWA